MKKSYLMLLLCLSFGLSAVAQSKMTEKEKRRAEKEALRRFRKMEPEQIKSMYERLQKAEKKIQSNDSLILVLTGENSQMRTSFDSLQTASKLTTDSLTAGLTATKDSLNLLTLIYDETSKKLLEAEDRILRPAKYKKAKKYVPGISRNNQMTRTAPMMMAQTGQTSKAPTGIYFRVQIGAYKKFHLNQNVNQGPFGTETEGDVYKYVFGYYSTLEEAEMVRTDFIKMGIKDAWVVGFDNGKRISKEEAAQRIGK